MIRKVVFFIFFFMLSAGTMGNESPRDIKVFSEALMTYEKMHEAFFKSDLDKVKKLAGKLSARLNRLEGKTLKKNLKYTMEKVSSLEKTANMESGQKDFNIVSQGLLMVLDRFISNKSYGRYYCPMVKKYWIQNISETEKVMNPYAPKTMPHCGGKME